MVDTPDRIWAYTSGAGTRKWFENGENIYPGTLCEFEYVRSDIVATLESENAELRAKLEEARRVIEPFARDGRGIPESLGHYDGFAFSGSTIMLGHLRAAARFNRGTE